MARFRHFGDVQNFIHTCHIPINLHERLGDIHDLVQHAGNCGYKEQIENEGHGKPSKIIRPGADENSDRYKDQINIIDDCGEGGHTVLPAQGKFQDPLCISGNRFFELFERGCRLVKCLHNRHSTNILHRSVVHFLQGFLILAHVLFHLAAAKANKLRNKRQNDTDQRGKPEPPVNGQ